jgi:membrane-bound serine protease (ClpP class)
MGDMKINCFRLLFLIFQATIMLLGFGSKSFAQDQRLVVYELSIQEDINANAWRNTQQAFLKASLAKADVILIKMNTFGGMVNFADSIRRTILDSPIKSIVYIDHNAASAGALIALAADRIYMTKGSSIGAASVVNQTGEIMPEKYQSYMRGLMRATAEAKGRNPEIAEAFVDPDVDLPAIKAKGKVLTLTSSEAVKVGIADGVMKSTQEVFLEEGIVDPEIIIHEVTFIDSLMGFLTNPAVQGFLIVLIMGGIYFELSSPGVGLPLVVAVLAAFLYFSPLYLEGLAANWEIMMFAIGVILLLLEIFVIPGFGIAGISGIAFIVCSFAFSMVSNEGFDFSLTAPNHLFRSFMLVIFAIVGAIIIAVIFGRGLIKTKAFKKLVLSDEQRAGSGYVSSVVNATLIDKEGIAKTDLRPSGKVEIEGVWYDAVALDGYVEKGSLVYVVKHENYNLFVRLKTDDSEGLGLNL